MPETYNQTTCFDRIVARSNVRLMKVPAGQYELKQCRTGENMRSQSGPEPDGIDHCNGTERIVKILSGGTSFKACNTPAGPTEGSRLVGIISHVAEVKERIDRQIVVTKEKAAEAGLRSLH